MATDDFIEVRKGRQARVSESVSKCIWRTTKKTSVKTFRYNHQKPLLLFEVGFQEAGRRKITSRRWWYERLRFSSRR